MTRYLFTYGTLLPEHAPTEIASVVEQLRKVGSGAVRGRLYDLGEYPGAVLDPSSSKKISGAVFQLPDDPAVLAKLDAYEGFQPRTRRSSLFVRTLCPVTMRNGRRLRCWIYVYNRKPTAAPVIVNGRYPRKRARA